jgi:hypothetical protein
MMGLPRASLRGWMSALVCAWALAMSGVMAAEPQSPAVEGFREIFNGATLDGWAVEATPGHLPHGDDRPAWSVEDGQIVCNGRGFGFLRYAARPFSDFTLRVEFQLPAESNSGIGIRTCPFDAEAGVGTRPSFHAYEIQLINDAHKPLSPESSGSLYRYVAPTAHAMKPAGEWNSIEVACRGSRIRIVLNGREVQDFDQTTQPETRAKPLQGYICLQNHCSAVRFRNIQIRDESGGR